MIYRLLPRDEWCRLSEILGGAMPLHGDSRIAVAENGNEIVGFHCLQPQFHVEPIWIHPEHRTQVKFQKMLGCLTHELPATCPYYAFAPDRVISLMAGQAHMKKLPWEVWMGEA